MTVKPIRFFLTFILISSMALGVGAAQSSIKTSFGSNAKKGTPQTPSRRRAPRPRLRRKAVVESQLIPPAAVLQNPEYLSGEARVVVAANTNPLIRLGIAQNGVTLVEFPATDKFFAIHAGNSNLVTVEKSPSISRDHHLVLRAGDGFLVPSNQTNSPEIAPATSIIAQMASGMAITLVMYPVPLLKQQAHRLTIVYNRDEVISIRQNAGLATNLRRVEPPAKVEAIAPVPTYEVPKPPLDGSKLLAAEKHKFDLKELSEAAIKEGVNNPQWFASWSKPKHGLSLSARYPMELDDTKRLLLFAVRNNGTQPLRLISGYPDVYVETLNESHRPVEVGIKVAKLYLASNAADNLIAPGMVRHFTLIYEAPILGAQQRLKLVVAHMNAADEPATIALSAPTK